MSGILSLSHIPVLRDIRTSLFKTHRCHKKEFLLKFAKDRDRWRYWLYEARKRYGLCILNYIITSNHIHLLVKQLRGNGISDFIQKFGGFASYINIKYKRKGHLFNNFKSVHIKANDQLKNVVTYIYGNPIALIEPGFKEKGIRNPVKVKEFLKKYKWSSYQDYVGIKNFHHLTERDFMLEIMGGVEGCVTEIDNYIMNKKDFSDYYRILE